jgi:hypothetical protein
LGVQQKGVGRPGKRDRHKPHPSFLAIQSINENRSLHGREFVLSPYARDIQHFEPILGQKPLCKVFDHKMGLTFAIELEGQIRVQDASLQLNGSKHQERQCERAAPSSPNKDSHAVRWCPGFHRYMVSPSLYTSYGPSVTTWCVTLPQHSQ